MLFAKWTDQEAAKPPTVCGSVWQSIHVAWCVEVVMLASSRHPETPAA